MATPVAIMVGNGIGAKNGIFPVDDKTIEYMKGRVDREYKVYAALRMIEQLTDDDLLDRYIFKNILKDYENIVDTTKFNRNEKTN